MIDWAKLSAASGATSRYSEVSMRKIILIAGGLSLVLAGCGSSSATAARPSTTPDTSTPAVTAPVASSTAGAAPTARVTVGPTNPAQSPEPKPVTIDLLVVKRNGAAIVIAPLVIRGRTYQFVVDTGATATVVDQTYAAQMGLVKTKTAPIPVTGVTGSGTAYLATIRDWQIGQAKIPTSTITVSNVNLGPGLVGLLGSDVLSTFGKVTIDYSAQKASLG
jgi:predicted aspartyl protease